jgi:hypothetical protein
MCCNESVNLRRRRPRRPWLLLALLVACRPVEPRATPAKNVSRPEPSSRLYTADEALRDALVGPWQYIGTGKWPGNDRMQACAFKNPRVFVVSAYCGIKDPPAIRVVVYSPSRGRTSIYAEGKRAVSSLRRDEYFTFMVESSPTLNLAGTPLSLAMSFDELRDYERRRYSAFAPVCYAGQERSQPTAGCLDALSPRKAEWERDNRDFLRDASPSWSRIVREMRDAGARYGRDP